MCKAFNNLGGCKMSEKKYTDDDVQKIIQETINQSQNNQKTIIVKDQGVDQIRKGCGFLILIPIVTVLIIFMFLIFM